MTEPKLTRPCVDNLTPYSPGKPIEEVQREFGLTDIVKLASNENPLGPSPKAVEAICQAASEVWLYPDNDCYHLRRALSEKLGFPGEQILLGHGSDGLIHNICLAFVSPGDEVMMSTAPFSTWDFNAKLMDGTPVYVPMVDFRYDTEAMAARVSARTKVVFIGNPHNPTGAMVTKAELEALLAALTDSTILVMDEAYYDYVDDPEYPDSLALVKEGRPVIVLRTFSKSCGLAGLRVGYGATTPQLADALGRVREPFDVNSVAQAAALASLQDPAQVERAKALNDESKEAMYAAFERLGLAYTKSYANFVWVDVGRDCREVFLELLKLGVIVRTGDIFGAPMHIRVSTGTAEQTKRFADALQEVLGGPAG
jgi:histidinol-phosphate aminotransferase